MAHNPKEKEEPRKISIDDKSSHVAEPVVVIQDEDGTKVPHPPTNPSAKKVPLDNIKKKSA